MRLTTRPTVLASASATYRTACPSSCLCATRSCSTIRYPIHSFLAPLSDAEKVDCLHSSDARQRSRLVTSQPLGLALQLACHPHPVACQQLPLFPAERHLAMRLLSHGPQHAKPAHNVHSSIRCTAAKANLLASEGDRGDKTMFLIHIKLVRSCAEKLLSDALARGISHPSFCSPSSSPLPSGEPPLASVTAIGGNGTGLSARAAITSETRRRLHAA